MADCYCDGDVPSVYVKTGPVARKEHRCEECGGIIPAGERYERVFAVCDGIPYAMKTCARCQEVRRHVTQSVPCFCWLHGNMLEMAVETAQNYAREVDGLLFGTYRRIILAKRRRPNRSPRRRMP